MSAPALIFLHAPSTYDFREMTILRGPVSDLVPSSSVFEMYPIGFTSMANHLEKHGYPVRIVNIAARMLKNPNYSAENCIASLPTPLIFGIDLHWLPHAHGAIEIAKLVRQYHPNTPILFGGFSSTYFHQELITYPFVDFVLRGDTTEDALRILMQTVESNGNLGDVPNLTWKDKRGTVHVNPMTYQPMHMDGIDYDFRRLMVSAVRDRDLLSYIPFDGWLNYPIMPAVSVRGCVMNCVGCGGSAKAYKCLHNRDKPVFRSPEMLAKDVFRIASVSNAPVFVLGDIRQAGKDYADRFLNALSGINLPLIIELFTPANETFIQQVARSVKSFALEVSIESHDPVVRKAYGKPYSTEAMETTIKHALDYGAERVDVFYMTGLPHQTYESVMGTADYTEGLLQRLGGDGRVWPFIGPMAPFIDPGSRAYETPDETGYKVFYRTLEEHRQALIQPSWQYTLNYETQWMTRREIVHSTYDVCMRFAELKAEYGLVPQDEATRVYNTLAEGKQLAFEIEAMVESKNLIALDGLRERVNKVNQMQGAKEHEELKFHPEQHTFHWLRLTWLMMKSWWATIQLQTRHRNTLREQSPTTVKQRNPSG